MPTGEAGEDEAKDTARDGQDEIIDGHQGVVVLLIAEHLVPDPTHRHHKTDATEQGCVDEEQQEGLVIA